MYRKSREAAEYLGISYYTLFELLRGHHLAPPKKDGSGDYIWTDADVERARHALTVRRHRKAQGRAAGGE